MTYGPDAPHAKTTREEARSVDVIWRRLDLPGFEWCRLREAGNAHLLEGIVLLSYEDEPCRIEYTIRCARSWQTKAVSIRGRIGDKTVSVRVNVTSRGRWRKNGEPCPSVDGAVDVDLGFSPSTNLLPIRRLELAIGRSAHLTAAWIEFPSLLLKPLAQTYSRLNQSTYRYESTAGKFRRDLEVDECDFVVNYPGIWSMESRTQR